jgi:hypothetical protein
MRKVKKLDLKKIDWKKLDVKRVRLGFAALILVVAIVLGGIALLGGDSGNDSSESGSSEEAVALSESELLARASSLDGPVFWIGPRVGTESYELRSTPSGQVYIRYLTGDAEAGDPRPDFLTIGTYPVTEALQALKAATKTGEGSQKLSQHEGYAVFSSNEATNAYVVFDDQPDLQVEIYSPQVGEAAQLATSGSLKPLG